MFGLDHVAAVSNARAGLSALLFDVLGDQFECRLSAGWDQRIHQDKVTAEQSFLDILDETGQAQT